MVTAHSHKTINSPSLSLLVTEKWQVRDDQSRFRVKFPAMKLFQKSHSHYDTFEKCTKVIKREHWITQRFTDLARQRISFAKIQDTHFPLDRYRRLLATTWASGSPRNICVICCTGNSQDAQFLFLFFVNNILHFANTERKMRIYIQIFYLLWPCSTCGHQIYHFFFLLVDLDFQNSLTFDQIVSNLIW